MQLILGAAYRHYQSLGETGFTSLAVAHTSWAFVVAGLAIAVGTMTQSRFGVPPLLRKLGFGLVLVTGIQFLLGVAALFAVMGGGEQRAARGHFVGDRSPSQWRHLPFPQHHHRRGVSVGRPCGPQY